MSFSLSEYTKIDVGWGFTPNPTGGAYSAPPDLAGFKGAASRQEGNGRDGRTKGKRESEEKGGMGKGGKGEVGGIVPWLLGG